MQKLLLYWNRRNFLLDPDEELLEEEDEVEENEEAKPAIPMAPLPDPLLLEVVEEEPPPPDLEVPPPAVDGILLITGGCLVDLFWDAGI